VLSAIACVASSQTENLGVLSGKPDVDPETLSVAPVGTDTVSPDSPIVIDDPDCLMISFTLICDTIMLTSCY